jgi:hypothetical protein
MMMKTQLEIRLKVWKLLNDSRSIKYKIDNILWLNTVCTTIADNITKEMKDDTGRTS